MKTTEMVMHPWLLLSDDDLEDRSQEMHLKVEQQKIIDAEKKEKRAALQAMNAMNMEKPVKNQWGSPQRATTY